VILALDSSTAELSLALFEVGPGGFTRVGERNLHDGGKHGTRLPILVDELLGATGVSVTSLSACVGGLGPGSFTGLRVGLATLKGICYARHIPLIGVSSARALAREAAQGASKEALFCTLLDARHGHLYASVYAGPTAEPFAPEVSLRPAELLPWLKTAGAEEARLIGEGVAVHREALRASFPDSRLEGPPLFPRAAWLAELVSLPLPPYDPAALFALEPHYVRASEAEEKFPQGTFVPRSV
jgi:tRNA threonylcarbamoyladenosine biosynthesis protein TsaB